MSEIRVHEEVFDGYPWKPTKPLTIHQLQIGDLLAKGCRPQFVRQLSGFIKSGGMIPLLFAETPAEATIYALMVKWIEKRRKDRKNVIEVSTSP